MNRKIGVALTLTVLIAPFAGAQGPPMGGPPPEMQAKMKAWQKWREKNKNIPALEKTMMGLSVLERDSKTRLSKSQSKTVLGVLKSWRNKKVMTNAQALQVNKKLTASLTTAQLKKLPTVQRRSGGPGRPGRPGGMQPPGPPPDGMGGPPPGGPPMGGPPPGDRGLGGPPRFSPKDFPNPRDYNPLNPATLPFPPERERVKRDLDTLTKTLAARAK